MDRSPPPPSFDELYQAHFDYVRYLARLAGVPEPETEDLAQSVFLALFLSTAHGRYDSSAPAKPWLKATTYRMARDYGRHLSNQERPMAREGVCDRKDEAMNAEQRVGLSQQWNGILDLLDALEPERRLILVMHDIDEMTLAQIADVLALSPSTVATRLRLAREDFAQALRRKRAEERRTLHEVDAFLLPLDASAILKTARALPVPEAPAEMRSRVWERVRRVTAFLRPMLPSGGDPPLCLPLAPRSPPLVPRLLPLVVPFAFPVAKLAGALLATFLLGAGAAAAVLAAKDRPASTPAINLARNAPVASAFADPSAAAPVPPLTQGDATSAAQPEASAAGSSSGMAEPVDADAADFAERLLIQRVRTALDPRNPNPAEALRLLHRYDDTYPGSSRFRKERDHLGHDALALQQAARGRKP